jgi:hypothetical protein
MKELADPVLKQYGGNPLLSCSEEQDSSSPCSLGSAFT